MCNRYFQRQTFKNNNNNRHVHGKRTHRQTHDQVLKR